MHMPSSLAAFKVQTSNMWGVGRWFFVMGSRVIGKDMLVCEAAPYFLQSISLQSCKTSEVFSKRALDLEGYHPFCGRARSQLRPKPWLFAGKKGIIVPSLIGIIIGQYKDPQKTNQF